MVDDNLLDNVGSLTSHPFVLLAALGAEFVVLYLITGAGGRGNLARKLGSSPDAALRYGCSVSLLLPSQVVKLERISN
jgi:hypothetical protein